MSAPISPPRHQPWLRPPRRSPLRLPRVIVASAVVLATLGLALGAEYMARLHEEALTTRDGLARSIHTLRQSELATLPTVEADLGAARAALAVVQADLPTDPDHLAFLSHLRATAQAVGLEITLIEPVKEAAAARPPGTPSLVTLPPALRYRLGLLGPEANLRAFLNALPGLPYPTLAVEGISITPKGTIVTLVLYQRPPLPPTPTPPRRPAPTREPGGRT